MPSITYDPTDGNIVVLGDVEDSPNAVIFRDRSGADLVIATVLGDSIALEIGTVREFILSVEGFGYPTGKGGAVSQGVSRATAVTLNNVCGQITGRADSLAGVTIATFTVNNTAVEATDTIILSKVSGDPDTSCWIEAVAANSFDISVRNNHASSADTTAMVMNFAIIKAVSS